MYIKDQNIIKQLKKSKRVFTPEMHSKLYYTFFNVISYDKGG